MKYRALGAALLFALLPAQAFAASRVWISEYGVLTATNSGYCPNSDTRGGELGQ